LGLAGRAEKAVLLAKQACMGQIDIQELLKNGAKMLGRIAFDDLR
jgi:tartrate dehydratase alpha subunit/fumarate hydratase class I-like protein